MYFLLAVLIGFFTGLLSGAFGIGGGILCTPLSRTVLEISPHVAVGTTLALIIPTALAGARNYWRQDLVALDLVKACFLPALLGTVLTSFATTFINGHVLMLAVAALIGYTGLDFLTGWVQRILGQRPKYSAAGGQLSARDLGVARWLGLSAGMCSGLLGVGGGFILTPGFCYLFGTSIKMAFGSSLLLVAAIAVPGTLVHCFYGHVNFVLALLMVVGALPGAWMGSLIALKVRDSWLKTGFGVLLILMALFFGYREIQEML